MNFNICRCCCNGLKVDVYGSGTKCIYRPQNRNCTDLKPHLCRCIDRTYLNPV
nr:MAG TPA: hypothetical protein [Caudoviricetes sp.]DAO53556.1 MAG TPA: hypothetical protein [Caudoviricetes sp.]